MIKFFSSKHKQENKYGPDEFCNKLKAIFRKNVRLNKYEYATSTVIPDQREYDLGKKAAIGSLIPNIEVTLGINSPYGSCALKSDIQIREAYIRDKENALKCYRDRRKPGIEWVAEEFQIVDRILLEFVITPIAIELATLLNDFLCNLDNDDCEKLAKYMVNRMISYISNGGDDPLFSLEDNLRIGIFTEAESIDYSSKKVPEEEMHVHPLNRRFRHSIKCLLDQEHLDWGISNGEVKIYNTMLESYPKPSLSNGFAHC